MHLRSRGGRLEYTSTHRQRDGKLHKIEVRLPPAVGASNPKLVSSRSTMRLCTKGCLTGHGSAYSLLICVLMAVGPARLLALQVAGSPAQPTATPAQPGLDVDRDPVPSPDADPQPQPVGNVPNVPLGQIARGTGVGRFTLREDAYTRGAAERVGVRYVGPFDPDAGQGCLLYVYEDGVPQAIASFRHEDQIAGVAGHPDRCSSGSMYDKGRVAVDEGRRWTWARQKR